VQALQGLQVLLEVGLRVQAVGGRAAQEVQGRQVGELLLWSLHQIEIVLSSLLLLLC